MGLGQPWGVQGSSPSLWGMSRDHQNAKRIPGREGRPSFTFHKGRRRGLHCGPCAVTHKSGCHTGLARRTLGGGAKELKEHQTSEQSLLSLELAEPWGALSPCSGPHCLCL